MIEWTNIKNNRCTNNRFYTHNNKKYNWDTNNKYYRHSNNKYNRE